MSIVKKLRQNARHRSIGLLSASVYLPPFGGGIAMSASPPKADVNRVTLAVG